MSYRRRQKKVDPVVLAFFCWAVAVVAAMFTLHYLSQMYLGWSSRQWPTAEARVLTAQETQEAIERSPWGKRKSRWKKQRYEVHQTFVYSYEVEGGRYLGDDISLPVNTQLNAATIRNHPQGTSLEIRYHPAEPSLAVVVPGTPEGAGTQLALRVFATGGSALLGYFFWRRFREQEDRSREARFES